MANGLQQGHGERGHVNVLVRDQDSVVTGKGKHARVICFLPKGGELYMRVDMVWNLPFPTEAQMLAVARKDQGVRGRWRLAKVEHWSTGGTERSDCTFKAVKP